ncbi:unnamed protein product [Gongylonema pulchrum]|uniref:Hexosyltransferase n=1 Tax=Gongylonema pulchrum TaxID=637853 RepID=A0A183ENA3_9BILA|nr:unnamed protein product [Gongylonema pulchrum]
MRRIHVHNLALRLATLQSTRIALRNELPEHKPISLTRHIPSSARDLFHWDFISSNNILFCAGQVNCPRHTVDLSIRTALNEIIAQVSSFRSLYQYFTSLKSNYVITHWLFQKIVSGECKIG